MRQKALQSAKDIVRTLRFNIGDKPFDSELPYHSGCSTLVSNVLNGIYLCFMLRGGRYNQPLGFRGRRLPSLPIIRLRPKAGYPLASGLPSIFCSCRKSRDGCRLDGNRLDGDRRALGHSVPPPRASSVFLGACRPEVYHPAIYFLTQLPLPTLSRTVVLSPEVKVRRVVSGSANS
jgi:hypothetical protein